MKAATLTVLAASSFLGGVGAASAQAGAPAYGAAAEAAWARDLGRVQTQARALKLAPAAPRTAPSAAPTTPAAAGKCGAERWAVKTLSDPEASQVDPRNAVDTTVAGLNALPRPNPYPPSDRAVPAETTVYRVRANLVGYKLEADRDIHLILADPNDPTATLDAESPDPQCPGAASSAFNSYFTNVRSQLQQAIGALQPTVSPQRPARPISVIVTGVAFFDRPHGQTGAAQNNIELHPVLDFQVSAP